MTHDRKSYEARWREQNRDRIRANARRYREENREEINRYQREWRRLHPDRCRDYKRKSREKAAIMQLLQDGKLKVNADGSYTLNL